MGTQPGPQTLCSEGSVLSTLRGPAFSCCSNYVASHEWTGVVVSLGEVSVTEV